ncbi:MAG: hypothetical protein MK033_08235 [Candidatus Caenarcaniphilales bacterium]|nr:hypothetical protein [Candidatus Caenarcaniphilales bacterium]
MVTQNGEATIKPDGPLLETDNPASMGQVDNKEVENKQEKNVENKELEGLSDEDTIAKISENISTEKLENIESNQGATGSPEPAINPDNYPDNKKDVAEKILNAFKEAGYSNQETVNKIIKLNNADNPVSDAQYDPGMNLLTIKFNNKESNYGYQLFNVPIKN